MKTDSTHKALTLYKALLHLYPFSYRKTFEAQILQTFRDHYRDRQENNEDIGFLFWADIILDEVSNILKERIAHLRGGVNKMNKYTIGITIGLLLAIIAFISNVVFPSPNVSDDQNTVAISLAYLLMFFIWGLSGYLESKKNKRLQAGAIAGAVTAVITTAFVMVSFILIDNLFFDTVKQQVDKVTAFHNQNTYHDMRVFINSGNVRALIIGIPVAGIIGACLGGVGSGIRRLRFAKH